MKWVFDENWGDMDLHELTDARDIVKPEQSVIWIYSVLNMQLCTWKHSTYLHAELRRCTEAISWSGVQGPTWQDSKESLPSKD